jgi:uncharacterized C2H2 Zn-finger protein
VTWPIPQKLFLQDPYPQQFFTSCSGEQIIIKSSSFRIRHTKRPANCLFSDFLLKVCECVPYFYRGQREYVHDLITLAIERSEGKKKNRGKEQKRKLKRNYSAASLFLYYLPSLYYLETEK